MGRTLLLFAPGALLIASAWARLEDGGDSALLAFAVLALIPALVARPVPRVVAAVAAALLAVRAATGLSPIDARPFDGSRDFVGPLLSRVNDGILAFYDVSVPFDRAERPEMDDVVHLAVFAFALLFGLALVSHRPLLAVAAVAAGTAWPVTLVRGSDLAWGAALLGVALLVLAFGGAARPTVVRTAVAAGGALMVLSLVATTSPAVAKEEFLGWRGWDPYDRPANPVSVRYVWNASYEGIRFPEKPTEVLRIRGPARPLYWRATTLDEFDGLRWREQLRFIQGGRDYVEFTNDPFLPAPARDRRTWVRTDVEVTALRDRRLTAASTPVAVDPKGAGYVSAYAGNVLSLRGGLRRGQRYTVWSYAPRPTPAQLGRVKPTALRRSSLEEPYLAVLPGAATLPFGTAGQRARVNALLDETRLAPYKPLVDEARRVTRSATNQYAAAVALEAWFRRLGGFTYDEQPPVPRDAPPLVAFVVGHKRGYCQLYAGAMALMLRYLGVPARVAAGFTSGSYDAENETWSVRDTNAHAWVEVWFNGWGWLPFDPTPGRGRLSGSYTTASRGFDVQSARQAIRGGAPFDSSQPSLGVLGELTESRVGGIDLSGRDVPGDFSAVDPSRPRPASLLRLLAVIVSGLALTVVLAKIVRRGARYLTRDPRRVAGACRAELTDFLRDRRFEVAGSATVSEIGVAIRERLGVDAEAFVNAAGTARYAPPDRASGAAREVRRELRRLLRAVNRKLSPFQRLRGLLSPRSLGLRA